MYRLISFFDEIPHVLSYVFGNIFLFVAILNSQRIKKFFAQRLFLFYGNISFMFYLLHFLLLFSFSGWFYHKLFPYMVTPANLTITAFTSLGVITLLSYILTKWVDAPAVKYSSMLAARIFK